MPSESTCHSFFFHHPATTEIYTLSLHDALPIFTQERELAPVSFREPLSRNIPLLVHSLAHEPQDTCRSEEHTSELQSQFHLVCRLLLEKKKNNKNAQFKIIKTSNIHILHLHLQL